MTLGLVTLEIHKEYLHNNPIESMTYGQTVIPRPQRQSPHAGA